MKIERIDSSLFETTLARPDSSLRGRINHNFHKDLDENPHRFLNVMKRSTYVTPHRHLSPPKSETFVVLRGKVAVFVFDETGVIERYDVLSEPDKVGACGLDLSPGIWHSLVVLSDHAICFEVKPGPYNPSNDKEFAPWAPPEGAPECAAYLEWLTAQMEP